MQELKSDLKFKKIIPFIGDCNICSEMVMFKSDISKEFQS